MGVPLGQDLVAWMNTHGVDVRPMAHAVGVHERTVRRWRSSTSQPQYDEAQRLAAFIAKVESAGESRAAARVAKARGATRPPKREVEGGTR